MRKRPEEQGLLAVLKNSVHARVIQPLGYFEFLALLKSSKIVTTDLSGIQKEGAHPRVREPFLVLRNSTERPEAVRAGFARKVCLSPGVDLAELESYPANHHLGMEERRRE